LASKPFISFSPTFGLGLASSGIRNHFNGFSWTAIQQPLDPSPMLIKRATARDLDLFSTAHANMPRKTIEMVWKIQQR
jgi:hypothetical protein